MGKRTLAGVGAIFASGLVATAFGACVPAPPAGDPPPAIVLEQVRLRHYDAQGVERTGTAEQVIYHRKEGRLEGADIGVQTPPTEDMRRGGLELEAARGEADLAGRDARLFDGVQARTGLGDRATTDEARWDAASETLRGDQPVQATGPGYRVDAGGFEFQVPGQRLQLAGDVAIHTDPEEAAP